MPSKLNTKTCAGWQHQLSPGYYRKVVMLLDSSLKKAFEVTQKNVVDVLILLYFIELIQQQQQESFNNPPQTVSREYCFKSFFKFCNEFPTKTTFPIGIVSFCPNASIFY